MIKIPDQYCFSWKFFRDLFVSRTSYLLNSQLFLLVYHIFLFIIAPK